MVNELPWGVKTLAPMAEEAGGVGLQVEVDKEGPVNHREAAMEDVKAVVQLRWGGDGGDGRGEGRGGGGGRRKGGREEERRR